MIQIAIWCIGIMRIDISGGARGVSKIGEGGFQTLNIVKILLRTFWRGCRAPRPQTALLPLRGSDTDYVFNVKMYRSGIYVVVHFPIIRLILICSIN